VSLCTTIPYHTISYHTIPYHTIPYHTINNSVFRAYTFYNLYALCTLYTHLHTWHVLRTLIQYNAIPYYAIPCHILYYTIPYHTTPHIHTISCHAIPFHTIYIHAHTLDILRNWRGSDAQCASYYVNGVVKTSSGVINEMRIAISE